ncbi:hypothetical protein B0H10DRAFT_1997879 [Mycena sp. CBHHK59/15]|nr:hypothetical protein B0H10DRAFT_1997879 [Mycena sp. CBHHK59/15]
MTTHSHNMEDVSSPPAYESENDDNTNRINACEDLRAPGYVYYRVYALDGVIPSKTGFNAGNPFLGRIKATSVPPPHTVASLKRCLAQAENLPDPMNLRTSLFQDRVDKEPMDTTTKVSIIKTNRWVVNEFALLYLQELSDKEKAGISSIDRTRHDVDPSEYSEDSSKQCFDPKEPAIGRIKKVHVPPPHNTLSVKRCIARAEGKPIYVFADLYQNISADTPMADTSWFTLSGTRFGESPQKPVVIVQPERRPGLCNRPLKVFSTQPPSPWFSWTGDFKWLRTSAGDLLHTDGISRTEEHPVHKRTLASYVAVASSGQKGSWPQNAFVHVRLLFTEDTKFLDL